MKRKLSLMRKVLSAAGLLLLCGCLVMSCSNESADEPTPPNPPATGNEVDPELVASCNTVIKRVADANRSYNDANVTSYLAKLSAQGAFSDINYSDQSATTWAPITHLDRLQQMASAYTTSESSFYQKESLYDQIVQALTYWNARKPTSTNWWQNQIAYPRTMGFILCIMRAGKKQVPEGLEKLIFAHLRSTGADPSTQTGANKADVGMCLLFRGCLSYNRSEVEKAVSEVFFPLAYTTEEGIQHDDSYFQHGRQLYIGGYAPELVKRVTEVASYTNGTGADMTADQVAVLSAFLRNTFFNCVRGNQLFFNVVGRSVSRRNALSAAGMTVVAERMKTLDPANVGQYTDIINKIKGTASYDGVASMLTHYYVGDFTVYRSKDYSLCVRMVSNRTCRNEKGNDENLSGYFLSDGSTAIVRTGNEYTNIFPLWNWYKIPGVTAPDMSSKAPEWGNWGQSGYSDFTGGLSNGSIGLSAYKMLDVNGASNKSGVNTTAYKAWFFFGKEVVCLGSGITSTNSGAVNTGVEQALLNGSLVYSQGGNQTTASVGANISGAPLEWVWHNNIGYFFPEAQRVSLTSAEKSGSWKDINLSQSATETQKVFTLWLEHGTTPVDASYSYVIVPQVLSADMAAYNLKRLEIVANTPQVQAVRDTEAGVTQIAFYAKGELTVGDAKISVDNPCLLMLKGTGDTLDAWVSDPSQKLSKVTVTVTRGGKSAAYTEQTLANDGFHKGKTHAFQLVLK